MLLQRRCSSAVLAIALIYMLLASQFESFLDPLVIMMAVPFAVIGIIGSLWITQRAFGLTAFIGSLMLVGIAVKNAILVVEFTKQLRRDEGMSPREALMHAGPMRLRPILMTALATSLGLLPMALGLGEGELSLEVLRQVAPHTLAGEERVERAAQAALEQRLLPADVVIDRGLRDPGGPRDVVHRCPVVAAFGEQACGRLDESFSRGGRLLCPAVHRVERRARTPHRTQRTRLSSARQASSRGTTDRDLTHLLNA